MAHNTSLASDIFLSVCITRRRPPTGRFDSNLRRHGASGGGMGRSSCWFDAITAGREYKRQENKDEQEWVKAASPCGLVLKRAVNHLCARNHFNSTALQPIVLRDKQS